MIGDGAGESVEGVIDVAGRTWSVAVDGVGADPPTLPIAVALAGLLLAGVVALLFVESSGRERRTRGELDRLQMRHDLILAAAGDGIVGVDRDGAIGFVNPAAARMLGWTPEEMTGRPVQEAIEADLAAPLRDGRVSAGEHEMRRRDGSTLPRGVHHHADRRGRRAPGRRRHLPRRHRPQAPGDAHAAEPGRGGGAGGRRCAHRPRQPPHLPRAPAHGGRAGPAARARASRWC